MKPINLLIFAFLFSSCSVHVPDIQQGNIITTESLEKLKLGMDKRQVEFVMGSPLLTDPFHANRWDYIYLLNPTDGTQERQHVTLFFNNEEKLSQILKQ